MNGTLVNGIAIAIGGLIGLFLQQSLFKRISDRLMMAIGLVVLIIGLQGVIDYPDLLVLIVSIAVGAYLGEVWDLDGMMNRFGKAVETKFAHGSDGRFATGLVSASLLFAVGAMAIVGSLESGLRGEETTLYVKSLLDFIAAIVFASTFGVGVIFSAVPVMLYQGTITLMAVFIAPYLTAQIITDLTAVGSLCIMALGTNMIGATKFKVANLLPSLVLPILLRLVWVFVDGFFPL
jgi:uncharacterized protein